MEGERDRQRLSECALQRRFIYSSLLIHHWVWCWRCCGSCGNSSLHALLTDRREERCALASSLGPGTGGACSSRRTIYSIVSSDQREEFLAMAVNLSDPIIPKLGRSSPRQSKEEGGKCACACACACASSPWIYSSAFLCTGKAGKGQDDGGGDIRRARFVLIFFSLFSQPTSTPNQRPTLPPRPRPPSFYPASTMLLWGLYKLALASSQPSCLP